jgi:transcription initiation factor TFIID TATA-box-binding protein
MIELVNITAGGDLGCQLRLGKLATDIDTHLIEYEPEIFPGIFLQFRKDGPKSTLYRTGKYVITGVDKKEDLGQEFDNIYSTLLEMGINIDKNEPTIYNMVFTGDLEHELRLSELAIFLGLNKTEYEPEQSPFLIYKPDNTNCTVTISRTGKIVITGIVIQQDAEDIYDELQENLQEIF